MSRGKATSTPMALRELLRDAIPAGSVEYGAPPPPHQFFVPKSHARALHLNVPLVLGDRGTGKSFWWSALQSPELRGLVEKMAPDTRIKSSTIVRPGFGKRADMEHYPSRDVLAQLRDEHSARVIWKSVMVWAVATQETLPELTSWRERVAWVVDNPEQADRSVQARDEALTKNEQDLLVVFDALDWAAGGWDELFAVVEGLLQVALEFRASRRIRAKVFLRSDQFDERRVAGFPDASKLVSSSVRLKWLKTELFGLLWQILSFHPEKGADFQPLLYDTVEKVAGEAARLQSVIDWLLPSPVYFETKVQEALFHKLTGRFMGKNARRGFPYTWLPTHLADAHDEVTPRSFLIALHTATQDTAEHHVGWAYALHPHSLHAGLQEASRVRVDEISEHPWVPRVMEGLGEALCAPLVMQELEVFWEARETLDGLRQHASEQNRSGDHPWFLPPHLIEGAAGVCRDLETLGVFRTMRDRRIDVPDIYRLGFGLRRKGGVAPRGRRA